MKILYIGSFNPITLGHIEIINYVLKTFKDSKITIVPSSDLYEKESLDTFFNDRFNMIRIALRNYQNVTFSNIEEELSKRLLRNPKTIETLLALKEFDTLLIGSDNYLNLDSWYKIDELLSNYKVMVYPRNKFDKSTLKIYEKYRDSFIFLDDAKFLEISSTEVREDLNQNKDTSKILDDEVLKYIKEHHLYEK